MNELGALAANLLAAPGAMRRAAQGVVHGAALELQVRLAVAGNLASTVVVTYPAPLSAVVGATRRHGVYSEFGAAPVRIGAGEVARSARHIAAGLAEQAARLGGGG